MLKFVKHHLETITGVEIFPLISFVIFFVFFLALLAFVFSERKEHINAMKKLPLEDII